MTSSSERPSSAGSVNKRSRADNVRCWLFGDKTGFVVVRKKAGENSSRYSFFAGGESGLQSRIGAKSITRQWVLISVLKVER